MKLSDTIHKAGIICCSNAADKKDENQVQQLEKKLRYAGIETERKSVFRIDKIRSGSAEQRAQSLMEFYRDKNIDAIFDISGGDIANEILPYIDWNVIAENKKQFWGYSDLTVIHNAVYAMTGNEGVLYQIRFFSQEREDKLFQIKHRFIQGDEMSGTVVGGNIRCLLKLAGTQYFPDMTNKLLLLEARGGGIAQMTAYFSQLKQMGAFKRVNGIILGQFTQMDEQEGAEYIEYLVKEIVGNEVNIARMDCIGHDVQSKAIKIGSALKLERSKIS